MPNLIRHFQTVKKITENKTYLFPTLRIVVITNGSLKWLIGGKEYLCNEGDIIFLNNSFERRITQIISKEALLDIFEFPPFILAEDIRLIEKFYDSDNCTINAKSENAAKIHGILNEIKEELKFDKAYKNAYIFHLLKACLCVALRDRNQEKISNIYTDTVLKATTFIWKNITENINAETVASELNINKKILEINFKKLHGRSICGYIRMCRVYRVARLIGKSKKNILDIALENGFTSSSGFYKAFHSIYHMSPKEYLKTIR